MSNINPKEVEKLCREAHSSASEAGTPVVAGYTFAIEKNAITQPLYLAEKLKEEKKFLFYGELPKDEFFLMGGGKVLGINSNGEGRFEEVAEKVDSIFQLAKRGGQPNLPLHAFGGFSFFDNIDNSQWPGFFAAQMVIPEWMILGRGGNISASVNCLVTPGDDLSDLSRKMVLKAKKLEQTTSQSQENPAGQSRVSGQSFDSLENDKAKNQWFQSVSLVLSDIQAGRLSKVVLTRMLEIECQETLSPFSILNNLSKTYPDCFNFLIDPGGGEVFLGATPERLAKFENGAVQLGALASTAPRSNDPEADNALGRKMLESRKERNEHKIVVDWIVEKIQSLGRLEWSEEPTIVKLNNLQHLYTPITLHPNRPVSAVSIIKRLHPTPAVGGYPYQEAIQQIRRHENFERGWYTAPIGWVDADGNGEFAVALRACTLNSKRIRLFAGGGIVADSDPAKEYLETQLKFRPILTAISNE